MPLVSSDSALSVLLTELDVRRLRWALVGHMLAAGLVLGLKAHASPELAVTCLAAWVCIIVAPAAGVAVWLRAFRHPERGRSVLRRMLVAPLIVGWLALVTLMEVMARAHVN